MRRNNRNAHRSRLGTFTVFAADSPSPCPGEQELGIAFCICITHREHLSPLGKVYFASLRLAVGLVCVGAGLILGCQWLGFIPDARLVESRARSARCETLATISATMIQSGQWSQLTSILRREVDRDAGLLTAVVRSHGGRVHADSGPHDEAWRLSSEDHSVQVIEVPISLGEGPWGQIEFAFVSSDDGLLSRMIHHPMFRLIGFFVVTGLGIFFLIVARVLRLFNAVQVVPDRVRSALDTLAEGLLVLDESEKIILANRAFSDTVGVPSEQLAGKHAGTLNWICNDHHGIDDYPWSRAIRERKPQTEQMLRYRLQDDRECIFSINSAPIQATDGRHRGALVTLRDVTHMEEHRAELETMLAMLRSSKDEISRKNRELEILATQDALTGCLNRRAFCPSC